MTTVLIASKFSVTSDGTMLNIYHANKGEGIPKHSHAYSHLTICMAGKCAVRKENVEVFLTKESQPVNLKPAEWHEIEAVEDGTVFVNVFSADKI